MEVGEKFLKNIDVIAENYFVDPSEKLGLAHFNLILNALGYVLKENTLLTGEFSFGKTSSSKVVLSVLSGLPYDLYDSCQIQGHPEATLSSLIGRPDMHRLVASGEYTIWNPALFLSGFLLDEGNRLPRGKQNIFLPAVDTGTFISPLGHVLYTGKRPFYCTRNEKDEGTEEMVGALLDRFAISIELGYLGPFQKEAIKNAMKNITDHLCDPNLKTKLLRELHNAETSDEQKFEVVKKCQKDFSKQLKKRDLESFTEEECEELKSRIQSVEWGQDAKIFWDMIETEINFSPLYSLKRRGDEVDKSSHSEKLASSKTKNSLSTRASRMMELYVQGIVYLRGVGKEKIAKKDILELAPYIMAHRIVPDLDFKANFQEKKRETGGTENFELVYQLVKGVEANYNVVHNILALFYNYLKGNELSKQQMEEVEQHLGKKDDQIDHPLLRDYIKEVKLMAKK